MGAWIEIALGLVFSTTRAVAPIRGRGLKLEDEVERISTSLVAPIRGRGLKYELAHNRIRSQRRPHTGAWIGMENQE